MAFINISPIVAAGLVIFVLSELNTQFVWGHGRLLEPPNRASLHRCREFDHLNTPKNYEDNELFCGGYDTQYKLNGGKCGVCGDNYSDPPPRAHEDGGVNYTDIIVRGYRSGDLIPVQIELTASHWGYFEFRLCAQDDTASHLTQECYDQHLLTFVNDTTGKSETKFMIPVGGVKCFVQYQLELPKGVSCKHCVLQWHYKTATRWELCPDGNGTGAMGCGDQEVFRGCSDIKIYPEDTEEINVDRRPNSTLDTPCTPENDFSGTKINENIILATDNSTSHHHYPPTTPTSRSKLLQWFNSNIRYYIPS